MQGLVIRYNSVLMSLKIMSELFCGPDYAEASNSVTV